MSRHTSDDPADLARRYWRELNVERNKQRMSVGKLSRHIREPESTLYFGFNERKSLPDKDLFVAIATALNLDQAQWASRWDEWDRARTAKATATQKEDPVSTTLNDDTERPRGPSKETGSERYGSRKILTKFLWAGVPLVALTATLLIIIQMSGPSEPDIATYTTDYRAHVDFYRIDNSLHLFDDDKDGRSAVLQYSINENPVATAWNTRGAGDNRRTRIVSLDLSGSAEIRYRVCTGEYNKTIYEETCSQWVNVTSAP